MKALKVFLALLVVPSLAFAAGSWSDLSIKQDYGGITMTATFTADASNGSVPDLTISGSQLYIFQGTKPWYLYRVRTDPGTTAPTDNYDILVKNDDGIDMAGGLCANRDEATTENARMIYFEPVKDAITISVSNNSVNSATCEIELFFAP